MSTKIHFSGIGGVAMCAGARLAQALGCEVRGSDTRVYPPTSQILAGMGVPVYEGYAAENLLWGPDLIVIGNALSRGNPEVEACLSDRRHFVSLPEWLKENVLRVRRPIVIAGTHGKTTTTAITAHLFRSAGVDAGYMVGGAFQNGIPSSELGQSGEPFILEGDEYDAAFFDKRAKFLHYLPETTVITALEFDHADLYKDLDEIRIAFERLLRIVPKDGNVVLCADNAAATLAESSYSRTFTYGLTPQASFFARRLSTTPEGQQFEVRHEGGSLGEFFVPLHGAHNVQNALAALVVSELYGLPRDAVREAMRNFPGVARRLDIFHQSNGIVFVSDFAHHPTAVKATLQAASERWPHARRFVLFEPRSNTTVTRVFEKEYVEAFSHADVVAFGRVYRAEKIPSEQRLDTKALAEALRQGGVEAQAFEETSQMLDYLLKQVRCGDVVLVMSNGAFDGIFDKIRAAFVS